jgi:hypothetical protein
MTDYISMCAIKQACSKMSREVERSAQGEAYYKSEAAGRLQGPRKER